MPESGRRVLPVGDDAVLVELGEQERVFGLRDRILELGIGTSVVVGRRTLLVRNSRDLAAIRRELADLQPVASTPADVVHHIVEVVYDGADLHEVAHHLRLSVEELVNRHAAASYEVAFIGFARGFPYLTGLDPRLELPRLATPRPVVPAGSVGIAADQCGIYPMASPGGWNLIGRAATEVFDVERDPPNRFAPGDQVTFVPGGR